MLLLIYEGVRRMLDQTVIYAYNYSSLSVSFISISILHTMNLRRRPPSPPLSPLGFGFVPPYPWIDDQSEQSESHVSDLPNGLPLDDMEIAPFAGVIDVDEFLDALPIGESLGVSGSVPSDEVGVYNPNLSPVYELSQRNEDLSPGNSDVLLLRGQWFPDANSGHSNRRIWPC